QFYLNTIRGLRHDLEQFQQIRNLSEQATFYRTRIAPKLWSPLVRFLIRRPAVLSLLGVPPEQIDEIRQSGHSSVSSFVEEGLEKTLTSIPMWRNYFWRVYINGFYPRGCCPNYLQQQNFQLLRERIFRIRVETKTMTQFLRSTDEQFSIFVLLDHM